MSAVPLRGRRAAGAREAEASLLAIERGLRQAHDVQLARLQALLPPLQRAAVPVDAAPVDDAVRAHLLAAECLNFDLLIPHGLRARASRRDEAAFRAQVLALAAATQATWSGLRAFLSAGGHGAAGADVLLSEFVLEARGLERGLAGCDALLARVLVLLRQLDAAGSDAGQADLARRAGDVPPRLDALREAARAAGQVRRALHDLQQDGAALHGQLHHLAQSLGGGLLERLRPVVAGEPIAPEELRGAQQARVELRERLAAAGARLGQHARLCAALGQALSALQHALP